MNKLLINPDEIPKIEQQLQQLESLLHQQTLALVAGDIETIALLSGQCADLCRRLKPLLPADTRKLSADWSEVIRRGRACQILHQENSDRLAQLSACCQKLVDSYRGAPLAYGGLSAVVYKSAGRSLLKV